MSFRHVPYKTWSWILGLALALILAGDRLALSAPDARRLRFAHPFTTASERAILDAAIAEFEQRHPGVQIEQTVFNSDTYQTIGWRLQFRGRKQPDVYFHWQGFKVQSAIRRGWALDVRPYLTPGFLEEFVPASVQLQEGGIYHLPQSVDISNLIWYNQTLFGRLGPEPRTLTEWLERSLELRRAGHLPIAQGNRDLWPMGNFGAELMGQSIGLAALNRLFDPSHRLHPAELTAIHTLERFATAGCFDLPGTVEPGGIASLTDIDAKVLFLSGKAAQHVVGSWFTADIQDARDKRELHFPMGVMAVPSNPSERNVLATVATGYLVNPASRGPKLAVAFVELLLSRKYQSRFAALGNLSVRRDAAEFTSDPIAKQMLAILSSAEEMVPPPDTGYPPEHANIFYEICANVLAGRMPASAAADYWNEKKQLLARRGL